MLSTSSSGMSVSTLESRAQPSHSPQVSVVTEAAEWDSMEQAANDAVETEVKKLMHETRLWRAANSVQWVAWGIVQAKLPKELARDIERSQTDECEQEPAEVSPSNLLRTDPGESLTQRQLTDAVDKRLGVVDEPKEDAVGETEQDTEAFDYLAYAHERALFFWGDVLQAGVIAEEEVPEGLRARVKKVEY